MSHYDFFQNKECEYFPCHPAADRETFSCLFCYCPLYVLGDKCGGSFRYTASGVKDCTLCLRPHNRENYTDIISRLREVVRKPAEQNRSAQLAKALRRQFPELRLEADRPLSAHTSLRIGGPAELMVFPVSVQQLSEILKLCNKMDIKPAILGAGTNILAPDRGVAGLVICLKDGLSGMEQLDDTHIRVGAGVTMTRAAMYAAGKGLSGLEFAHGIPGTVGGGVYMNAGAYGGEISSVCESAVVVFPDGTAKTLSASELDFRYRHSILEENGGIAAEAVFRLTPDDPEEIRRRMRDLQARRSASQPLDLPSAGSAFKRPQTGYAAALIDQSGLKGFRIGNAAISMKHAGFAVNLGGASSEDFIQLLNAVSDRVYADSGVRLEPEIRIW